MRKQLISLCLVLVLICSFILSFAGCGGAAGDTAGDTSADGSALSTSAQKDVETLRLIPTLQEEAVAPIKKTYSDEIQAILDEYYQKMLIEYPSWRQIPRRMLREYCSEHNGFVNVEFTFCLGGVGTHCMCSYSNGPANPEGHWTIWEDGFKKFYTSGVTQAQMDYIRDRLAAEIEEMIEEKGLIEREPVRESIYPWWLDYNGELLVRAEYIAYYPNVSEDQKGCGIDHEHLFGRILLE